MKKYKSYFLFLVSGLLIFYLSGCASVPRQKHAGYPTFNLNGAAYLSLAPFCESNRIDLQYDTFARTVTLNKNSHRIDLRANDNLVLVDGKPEYLAHVVDTYQGTLAVPLEFKEKFLDRLFGQTQQVSQPTCSLSKLRKIVIDAGHGGNDPGAIGRTGLREKDVNLDIAKRLAKLLSASGVEVVMTRSVDRFIPLSDRVDIANNSGADVFVSIHSNANRTRSMNGFEVYYVAPTVNDSTRAYNAARNARLGFDDSNFASHSLDLKAILWDMIYTGSRAESIQLSHDICRTTNNDLECKILGVKGARYYVLKGVRMPAVLIEVGFVSNLQEERMLKNSFYRGKIAESIVRGVEEFAGHAKLMETVKK